MWQIFKRELSAYFISPAAYALSAVYLGLSGWIFLYLLRENLYTPRTGPSIFALAAAFWLPLLIAGATMRLFAEERQSGTLETLLTAPVTDGAVVGGKYLAALSFVLGQVLLATVPMWALRMGALHLTTFDAAGLAGALLMLALLGASGTALGTLVSLCTRHQSVAMALTLTALAAPYLLYLAGAQVLPSLRWHFGGFPIETQLLDFARGVIDFRWVLLHLSVMVLSLFFCVRILEARLWRR